MTHSLPCWTHWWTHCKRTMKQFCLSNLNRIIAVEILVLDNVLNENLGGMEKTQVYIIYFSKEYILIGKLKIKAEIRHQFTIAMQQFDLNSQSNWGLRVSFKCFYEPLSRIFQWRIFSDQSSRWFYTLRSI